MAARCSPAIQDTGDDMRSSNKTVAALAASVVLLAACGGGGGSNGQPEALSAERASALKAAPPNAGATVRLRVLSSATHQVSGGDARIEVRAAPGLHDKLELWL